MPKDLRLTVAGLLFMATFLAASGAGADEPPAAGSAEKIKAGLSHTAQLLELMDTDKSGELGPKVQHWLHRFSRPTRGPGR